MKRYKIETKIGLIAKVVGQADTIPEATRRMKLHQLEYQGDTHVYDQHKRIEVARCIGGRVEFFADQRL